jgi:hypothetical protein
VGAGHSLDFEELAGHFNAWCRWRERLPTLLDTLWPPAVLMWWTVADGSMLGRSGRLLIAVLSQKPKFGRSSRQASSPLPRTARSVAPLG